MLSQSHIRERNYLSQSMLYSTDRQGQNKKPRLRILFQNVLLMFNIIFLELSQQLRTSLHDGYVWHCKLHEFPANYCLGVIYTSFHEKRNEIHTCKRTPKYQWKFPRSCSKTAYEGQPCVYIRSTSPTITSAIASIGARCCEIVEFDLWVFFFGVGGEKNYHSLNVLSSVKCHGWHWRDVCCNIFDV